MAWISTSSSGVKASLFLWWLTVFGEQAAQGVGAKGRLGKRGVVGAPPQGVAAVDSQDLACHPRRFRAREVAHGAGDVLDGSDPAHGHLREIVVEHLAAHGDH